MKQFFSILCQKIIIIIIGLLLSCGAAYGDELATQRIGEKDSPTQLVTKEESAVVSHVIEHMLARLAENNQEPTESLLRVYLAVTENGEVKIEDLNELLPEMLECMKEEQDRAARPDSPGIGNGAISGCCGGCDFSQILAILGAIQARLVIINNLIIECCDEIRFDFQATWSILANLNVTATVDLNPVFSVIDACCNGTFSTLANLSFTAVVDFSPVFTALNTCCNGTFTALAACCNGTFSMLDKIDREVISTFSVLNTIIINEQGTFTTIAACCNGTFSALAACCNGTFSMLDKIDREVISTFSVLNTIIINEQGTFTTIAACCNGTFSVLANLNLTATADLSGIFTALNTCCNGTFSMLNKIDREVIGTFSVLNTIIINEQGTFTAIAACCNGTFSVLANLNLTATTDLSGIFTALNTCCNSTFSMLDKIDREVISTFSLLNTIIINEQGTFTAIAACCNSTFSSMAECCNGTFSVLANLNLTATTDLSGIFTALSACCNGTFSVLANLSLSSTTDLSGVFSTLADIKASLTCSPIPIFTPTAITAPGNYCLANDIVGTISILSDNVFLDLNGKSVTATDTSEFGSDAIFISSQQLQLILNVTVRNGSVIQRGISVELGENILLDTISAFSIARDAFDFTDCAVVDIKDCLCFSGSGVNVINISGGADIAIKNFQIASSMMNNGITLNGALSQVLIDKLTISNCTFINNAINGANVDNLAIQNFSVNKNTLQSTGISLSNCRSAKLVNGTMNVNTNFNGFAALTSCQESELENIDFTNDVCFNAPFNISGGQNISMKNCAVSTNTFINPDPATGTFIINVASSNNLIFERNEVRNNTFVNPFGVISVSGDASILRANRIVLNDFTDTGTLAASPIMSVQGSGSFVKDLSFVNNTRQTAAPFFAHQGGIEIVIDGILIIDNTVTTSGQSASFVQIGRNKTLAQNINIMGNVINGDSPFIGIDLVAAIDNTVRHCLISGNTHNVPGQAAAMIQGQGDNNTIEFTEIVRNTAFGDFVGVNLPAGDNCVVRNCLIAGNRSLTNNTIVNGINLGGAESVAQANTVSYNTNPNHSPNEIAILIGGGLDQMIFSNKIQGQNSSFTTGVPVPLLRISYSTGAETTVSAGQVSPFHNLEMVP